MKNRTRVTDIHTEENFKIIEKKKEEKCYKFEIMLMMGSTKQSCNHPKIIWLHRIQR